VGKTCHGKKGRKCSGGAGSRIPARWGEDLSNEVNVADVVVNGVLKGQGRSGKLTMGVDAKKVRYAHAYIVNP
jgi:hypothetical protein